MQDLIVSCGTTLTAKTHLMHDHL